MTQSNSTVAYAAANAAQSEATASKGVYDSLVLQAQTNPKDEDLAASVLHAKAEADKDQAAADELLTKAMQLEEEEKAAAVSTVPVEPVAEVIEPVVITLTATVPAVEVVEPVVQPTQPEPVVQEAAVIEPVTAAPQVIEVSTVVQPPVVIRTPLQATVTQTAGDKTVVSDFLTYVEKLKATGTHLEKAFIAQMESYISKMKPGLIVTPEEGANNQYNLWRLINTTLNNSTSEFSNLYGLLLGYAYSERTGVFHDRYVFRFAEHLTFAQDEIMAFHAILNLINITCIPGDRKAVLRQVDLRSTLQNFFNEETRQRVIAYYS